MIHQNGLFNSRNTMFTSSMRISWRMALLLAFFLLENESKLNLNLFRLVDIQ